MIEPKIVAGSAAVCMLATGAAPIDPWAQYGIIGVLGAILFIAVNKTIPKLGDDLRKASENYLAACESGENRLEDAIDRQTDKLDQHMTEHRKLLTDALNLGKGRNDA